MLGRRCIDWHPARRPLAGTGRHGLALMSALVLLAVLAASMGVSINYLWQANRVLRHEWEKKQSFHLAESGVEHAIAGLLGGKAGEADLPATALGSGEYWAKVEPEPGRAGHYHIRSMGQIGDPQTGPVSQLDVVVRIERLFGGASRRATIVTWNERRVMPQAGSQATQPSATQPASTRPAASRPAATQHKTSTSF